MAATRPGGGPGEPHRQTAVPGWADVDREDAEALLEARRELGPSYDDAVVDAFADRVEQAISSRVETRLAHEHAWRTSERRQDGRQMTLGITSLALGVPISGIAAGISHLPGLAVAWAGIAVVNLAYAWQRRPRRDR